MEASRTLLELALAGAGTVAHDPQAHISTSCSVPTSPHIRTLNHAALRWLVRVTVRISPESCTVASISAKPNRTASGQLEEWPLQLLRV
ncbi:hypothetical protein HBI24_212250 [Parastagonospora nodorum]|nr:hypothetical protein HBH53_191720 [Parastagonospora nodorum]KAH4198331.1 hypothetical protein HBI95_181230 [Parastagonospora nodorum]KAH4896225.1 hypothetical protein HBI80_207860 [Parastagonospora nodorum]KAH4978842.1 hypothetical protein HBI76_204780 [Parastagonospora nodorum]KAH5006028.1 hypothetical protein HBI74_222570 [Parastagonospora nodorum]